MRLSGSIIAQLFNGYFSLMLSRRKTKEWAVGTSHQGNVWEKQGVRRYYSYRIFGLQRVTLGASTFRSVLNGMRFQNRAFSDAKKGIISRGVI
jgi:hypothetical protein